MEERRLWIDERSPDRPDPEHDRLNAAALEAVRGERLDARAVSSALRRPVVSVRK
ncbi:hypothetical protein ACQPZP_24945 [Spirillospora sp. CA-142024]|uniref:hypothetical protein n=1 Tax=Spirillospora sp. CA-142024 TaxID=3240036 RepID=UPI003D8DE456